MKNKWNAIDCWMVALGATFFSVGLFAPRFALRNAGSVCTNTHKNEPRRIASVEVIIPAYLESSCIGSRVEELRRQTQGSVVPVAICVVASDQETAAAAAVAGARVQHHSRSGKAAAINAAVSASRADLIVLTDANCSFAPKNWLSLVIDSFCCAALICGRKAELGSLERLSRRYAEFDLTADSREVVALPFAVGEALAFRRSDFVSIPETTLVDDLAICLSFIRRRLPVGVAPKWAVSEPAANSAQQWERRVRMATGVMREVSPQIAHLLHFPQGRVLLVCKYWRLTIGNAAYWAMVVGLFLRFRKGWQWFAMGTLAIVPGVLFKVGLLGRSLISQLVVPLALQAVPPVAVVRLMRRPSGVWRKEPR